MASYLPALRTLLRVIWNYAGSSPVEGSMNYIQCKLRRRNKVNTAWIPEQFAVQGKFLEIRGEDGWQVETVYGSIILPYETVNANSRDYLRTRRASDM